ncbi:polysaccharide deacetylase family protein [candidate division WOR-3 bacterium]|nr:polysaccharide deacetylase family protein [candidate division WOR-3 bacterium]
MNKNQFSAGVAGAFFSFYIYKRGLFDKSLTPILLYHDVTDRFYWTFSRTTVHLFRKQMSLLRKKDFFGVGIKEAARNKTSDKMFAITFDDALESVAENAFPVIEGEGFKADVYIVTDYAGRTSAEWDVNLGGIVKKHMDWDKIAFLSQKGWGIGSHSCTHRDLTLLTPDEVSEEAERSKQEIIEKTGVKPAFFSYPFGRTNPKIARIIQKAGYDGAVTSYPNRNSCFDPFMIGRRPVYLFDSAFDVLRRVERSSWKNIPYDFAGRGINFFARGVGIYKEKIEK